LDGGDLLERRGRCCSSVEKTLEQPRLDELREKRRGEQASPPKLVEPARQERRRGSGLTAGDAYGDTGLQGFGLRLEAVEQLLGLVEAALEHPNLRQASRRRDAARALAYCGELTHRELELCLG
jgi:hypothetical protein